MEVENYRVDGKVRQHIIRYIGRTDKPSAPTQDFTLFKKKIRKIRKNGIVDVFISKNKVNQRVLVEYRWKEV